MPCCNQAGGVAPNVQVANFELTEEEAYAAAAKQAAAAAPPQTPSKLWAALLQERHEQQQIAYMAELGRGRRQRRTVNYADAADNADDDAKADSDGKDSEFDDQAAAGHVDLAGDDDDSDDELPDAAAAALELGMARSQQAQLQALRVQAHAAQAGAVAAEALAGRAGENGNAPQPGTLAANVQYLAGAAPHAGGGSAQAAAKAMLKLQQDAASAQSAQQLPALVGPQVHLLRSIPKQISIGGGAWTICGLSHDARMAVLAHLMQFGLPLSEQPWEWGALTS